MHLYLTLLAWGRKLSSPDDQIASCFSKIPYLATLKLSDFKFLSIRHIAAKF